MAVGQSNFPAALDTPESLIQVANGSTTTLSSNINPSATTLNVGSTLTFPNSGTLIVEDEILYYTGKTATAFTGVTRGEEGTTESSHSSGTEVQGLILASHHNVLADALIRTQTQIGAGATTLPAQIAALEARVATLEAGASLVGEAGIYRVADYSASGSRSTFTGTIQLASANTLTLTADSDFKVGQGVYIAGAAASGSALVTLITAVSANTRTLTLQTAATTAVTSALVQHDDTVAIQAAINACFNAGGGTIDFDYAFYRVNGPVRPETNSILYVPHNPYGTEAGGVSTAPFIPLRFRGRGAILLPPHTHGLATVIDTDRAGTNAESSILSFGLMDNSNNFWGLNYIHFVCEDISFTTYNNPQISGLDCGMVYNIVLKNMCIWPGIPTDAAIEPTSQTFALRLPRAMYSTVVYLEQVSVGYFPKGIVVYELMNANQVTVFSCKVAIEKQPGEHFIFGTLCLVRNTVGIRFIDGGSCDLKITMETYGPLMGTWWFNSDKCFDDPQNKACGLIAYSNWYSNPTGGYAPATITGCPSVNFTNYRDGSIKANAISAETLSVSGSFLPATLEVSGETKLRGPLSLTAAGELLPVSFGADNSQTAGFREVRIPNQGAMTLLTGLLSYWKFEEPSGNFNDSLGLNPFIVSSGAPQRTAGKIGNCVNRDSLGNTQTFTINVADAPAIDLSASSLTFAVWVYFHNFGTGAGAVFDNPPLLAKVYDSHMEFIIDYTVSAPAQWRFRVSSNKTTLDGAVSITASASTAQWYFVVARLDLVAGQISLSINGAAPATAAFTSALQNGDAGMLLGSATAAGIGGAQHASAAFDEIGIWKRALSQAEVTELYNGGAGKTYPFS